MKELFYFSHSDLMIQVEPDQQTKTYQYSSHRKITFSEREIVERYLINNVVEKTEINPNNPACLCYTGIDIDLEKEFKQFQQNKTNKILSTKEKTIDNAVESLIAKSMSNYYFEQIGDTILELKKMIRKSPTANDLTSCKQNLVELVKAYNMYSLDTIKVEDVLPKKLSSTGQSAYSA